MEDSSPRQFVVRGDTTCSNRLLAACEHIECYLNSKDQDFLRRSTVELSVRVKLLVLWLTHYVLTNSNDKKQAKLLLLLPMLLFCS